MVTDVKMASLGPTVKVGASFEGTESTDALDNDQPRPFRMLVHWA